MSGMPVLPGLLTIVELLVFATAATAAFRWRGLPGSDAVCLGLLVPLAGLSFLYQCVFLAGSPMTAWPIEAVALVASCVCVARRWPLLRELFANICNIVRASPIAGFCAIIAYGCLGALAVVSPPSNWDSMTYNLARVLLFEQEGTLFLERVTTVRQAAFPLGWDILAHSVLRYGSDWGVAFPSFMAYSSILAGAYSIARRLTGILESFASALAVGGLTALCYQATTTKNDIAVAAAAVACVLGWVRFRESRHLRDVVLVFVSLCFGVASKSTFLAFGVPFVCLMAAVILFEVRRERVVCGRVIKPLVVLLMLVYGVVSSQLWLLAFARARHGTPLQDCDRSMLQTDGLAGAAANVSRYLVQSVHFFPLDWAMVKAGRDPWGAMDRVYERSFGRMLPDAGIAVAEGHEFHVAPWPHEDHAWFGPLGWLLVVPAMAWSIARGNITSRLCAWSGLLAFGAICYKLVWLPWNGRYLVSVFVVGSLCIADLIRVLDARWRAPAAHSIAVVGALLMLAVVGINQGKAIDCLGGQCFLDALASCGDRFRSARSFFGDDRVDVLRANAPTFAKVGLLVGDNSWVYPFLISRTDVKFLPIRDLAEADMDSSLDFLVMLDEGLPEKIEVPGFDVLWVHGSGTRPGAFLRRGPTRESVRSERTVGRTLRRKEN